MITLVITVVIGVFFAFFATQNTGYVTVQFVNYSLNNIPLYLVAIIPLLVGILASLIIYVTRDLSSQLTMNEQKDEIKKLKEEKAELTKKVHKLELENTKLKSNNGEEFDEDSI